jgi:hypothetical protein
MGAQAAVAEAYMVAPKGSDAAAFIASLRMQVQLLERKLEATQFAVSRTDRILSRRIAELERRVASAECRGAV